MWTLPGRLLGAVSDATIGTAIVMVHLVMADRDRVRRSPLARRPDTEPRAVTATRPTL
jgi:hypothetical protein